MSRAKITKQLINGLLRQQPPDDEEFLWDEDLRGFGIRIQKTGVMSYVCKYRAGIGRSAPTRRITIGGVGKLPPDEARIIARQTLGLVAHGKDPAAE